MNQIKRIGSIIAALFMISGAALMVYETEFGYPFILLILGVSLELAGIRELIYYFSMARHMVGGNMMLIKGVILLDFGALTVSLTDVPSGYVILYLLGIHVFSGIVEVLRAFEAKRYGGSWKLKFFHGILNMAIVLICVVNFNRPEIAVYVYASGLVYSAILRVITAFRRTAVVSIQ